MATITSSTTLGLSLEVGHEETLSQGDFILVDDTSLIAQISHTETDGGAFSAEATFVGEYPDQPIPEGKTVSPAPAELVRSALRLPSDGVYLGEIPNLDSGVYLNPNDLMRKQVGIFGRTGSGKSYSAAVLIEELLEHNMPVLIIDPHGEYTSLQVAVDGSPSEYLVKHYADLEWVPEADEQLDLETLDMTELVAPGQATILDLHGLGDKQERVVAEVLERAFLSRKREQIPEVKVIIEEAHKFATKNKSEPRSVIRNIAKEGRKFQFTLGVVSQRPSGIDHNVRAQLQSMALHKLTDDTDVAKAIEITEGIDRSWNTQIQQLHTGECILAGDLIASPTFVEIRERRTMHQSDDENGLFSIREHAVDPDAIERQQSELAEYVEEMTADELRRHVHELTRRHGMDTDELKNLADGSGTAQARLKELREELSQSEETIEQLEAELEAKTEHLQAAQQRLTDQSESKQPPERTAEGTAQSSEAAPPQRSTPNNAGETDELLTELEDGGPAYSGEWNTQPEEARPRDVVLKNKYVVRKVKSFWKELDELSRIERKTLRQFKQQGTMEGERAFTKASGPVTDTDASTVINRLEGDGFIARTGRGKYAYNLDNRIENRFYDLLHQDEFPFVIDAVEQKL